jgi:hypothetical protein
MARELLRVEVSSRGGEIEIREFDHWQPLRIGSGAECELRLDDPDLPALHALLKPASNHRLLFLAAEGVLPAQSTRVDYGVVQAGRYTVRVLPPSEEES